MCRIPGPSLSFEWAEVVQEEALAPLQCRTRYEVRKQVVKAAGLERGDCVG